MTLNGIKILRNPKLCHYKLCHSNAIQILLVENLNSSNSMNYFIQSPILKPQRLQSMDLEVWEKLSWQLSWFIEPLTNSIALYFGFQPLTRKVFIKVT